MLLLVEEADGKWHPISFTSRKLSESDKTFTVTEREYLAVVDVLRKWHPFPHGEKEFIIVTDHCSLKLWLMSSHDPRERLARWMIKVQEFHFIVQCAPGSALVVTDALSRDIVEKRF